MNVSDYVAGDTLILEIDVVDADGNNVPLNDASARWGARNLAYNVTVVQAATIVLPNTIRVNVAAGKLNYPGEWEHEFEVVKDGQTQTVKRGIITAARQVIE